jgi:protein-L-isoaspartate(D-aspartate) O-methyltransferase
VPNGLRSQQVPRAYVARLKAAGVIRSPAVEAALGAVPRHALLERVWTGERGEWTEAQLTLELAYSERALITRLGADGNPTSSSSQPALVASMLEALNLAPGMRVLEIGAGTGYNAALISEIVGDQSLVTTIDYQADVVAQTRRLLAAAGYGGIDLRAGDGFEGAADRAPFDRIVATVGVSDLAPAWLQQLQPDGHLLLPLRHDGANPLIDFVRDGPGVRGRYAGFSGFMPIQGALHDPAYAHPRWADQERREMPALAGLEEPGGLLGFWFHLGIRDPRTAFFEWKPDATHPFGLVAGEAGRVLVGRGSVVLAGEESVLADLRRHHAEWDSLGRPRADGYEVLIGLPQQPGDFAVKGRLQPRLFRRL